MPRRPTQVTDSLASDRVTDTGRPHVHERALLDGRTLASALDAAGADFSFERWLARALAEDWIAAATPYTESFLQD